MFRYLSMNWCVTFIQDYFSNQTKDIGGKKWMTSNLLNRFPFRSMYITRFKVGFPTMIGSFLTEKESCQISFPAVCLACSSPQPHGPGLHREGCRKAVRFSLDLEGLCGYRFPALSSILLCLGATSSLDLRFKWQERFSFWSWACEVSMQELVSALW